MAKQTLSFYTTGEGFTGLLNSFFEEGRFKALYETLDEGGLPHEQIVIFFMGLGYFEGDTRGDGTLTYHVKAEPEKDIAHRVYWALRNTASNKKKTITVHAIDEWEEDHDTMVNLTLLELLNWREWDNNDDIKALTKVWTKEQIIKWILPYIIKGEGYQLNPDPSEFNGNGAITKDGDYITCFYQDHDSLYPLLSTLGLSDSGDWTDDESTLHVSSSSISGKTAHSFEHGGITFEQIKTLIKYKKSIRNVYASHEGLFENIREYFNYAENHGGKYNNLCFLKTAYPHFNLPIFSKEPIAHVKNCLRTSPKYSLPGLLESMFDVVDHKEAIAAMAATFETYKDVHEGNEFHYFFQEFIEGTNGVFHITKEGFKYAVGDKQGDIVRGKTSGLTLSKKIEKELKDIATELYEDMKVPLQVEFVVTNDNRIYIVQLRKLVNSSNRYAFHSRPDHVVVEGKGFSIGEIKNITADEILVVDDDADSKQLLGKKMLIVKNNVEFSHILALAASLYIPAIYNTGSFTLPKEKLSVKVFEEKGYIYKS